MAQNAIAVTRNGEQNGLAGSYYTMPMVETGMVDRWPRSGYDGASPMAGGYSDACLRRPKMAAVLIEKILQKSGANS